jgi:hypothetical protein
MKRFFSCLLCIVAVSFLGARAFSQEAPNMSFSDMEPVKKQQEYKHVLAIGANQPFSKGSNSFSPLIAYYWFGDNWKDHPNLYTQFTFTTTRIFFILAYRTNRVYAGIKPLLEHSTYSGWKSYNRGYDDKRREFGGNNGGVGGFLEYKFLRILSARVNFHASYHFYRMFLLTPNEGKYDNMPHRHWQIKPWVELELSDVKDKSLTRIKHGYQFRVEYHYARRIGYGTWYDYDRMWYQERYNGTWLPGAYGPGPLYGANATRGIWYRSKIKDTNRLYFSAGGYYNFKYDINLQYDFNGGYFTGVDRNNAEQIGYYQADYAIMPGYFCAEFYHNFYLVSRIQMGFPLKFWDARIQPGFNVLYLPKTNEVIGVGRGAVTYQALVRPYPRRFYTSVSCSFSLLLGNLLPFFVDYAYGIDAIRTPSSHKVYLQKLHRGNHEFQAMFVMAFDKGDKK